MGCSLAALALCFSWSNLYLGADAQFIDQPDRTFADRYYGETFYVMPANGTDPFIEKHVIREFDSSSRKVNNPYAGVSLGYEMDFRTVRINLSGFYRESARISDKGEKGASLNVQWFPLRRH